MNLNIGVLFNNYDAEKNEVWQMPSKHLCVHIPCFFSYHDKVIFIGCAVFMCQIRLCQIFLPIFCTYRAK